MEFVCNECGVLFTQKQSLLRHVRTVHQGMKRTDNEKRKREVTDKAGNQGILACTDSVHVRIQLTRPESRGSLHIPIRVYVRFQLNLTPGSVQATS